MKCKLSPRRLKILFLILGLSLVSGGQAHSQSDVKIFAPKSISETGPLPLVLLLHGYMGDQNLIDSYYGYSAQVEKRKFILVVPNGRADSLGLRYWNASPACCDFDHRENDDVQRLKDILNQVMRTHRIDKSRVFVVGHSNGGFMAHRLACEFSETITGLISFAGMGTLESGACQNSRAVSVLQIHAQDDETILFKGDVRGYEGLKGYPSADQTVSDWAARNGCHTKHRLQTALDLTISIPGSDASVASSERCRENVSVEFWKIQPFKSVFHSPHTPFLRDEFTGRTLDFIFSHPRL